MSLSDMWYSIISRKLTKWILSRHKYFKTLICAGAILKAGLLVAILQRNDWIGRLIKMIVISKGFIMNDRREDEKAIDYVRRKVEEARVYCKTEEEFQGIDTILEALSRNDYIFIDLTIKNAHKILQLTGLNLNDAVDLYREMVNPEEKRKYREFKAQKRTQKQKEFVESILKRCDSFISKVREILRKNGSDRKQ